MPVDFEWDEEKAASNERKHGVPFSYATLAFEDPARSDYPQPEELHGEDRWLLTGLVESTLLAILYTMRVSNTRIISARKATATPCWSATPDPTPSPSASFAI